jgi:hypothetical protein
MTTAPAIRTAWQPLTFRGVAAFAHTRWERLVAVQFCVALLSAGIMAGFFQFAWVPSIRGAINRLPDQGAVRDGILRWNGPAPERFGQGGFVSFLVDPENSGQLGQADDVELIFTRSRLWIRSLFGYASVPYPLGAVPLNRPELEPWWGAWSPAILTLITVGGVGGLMGVWWGLALLYMLPIRIIAFYADRPLTWGGAWRLAGAAVLPGALFMDVAILGYALRQLNLLQLLVACAGHFLVGWLFAAVSPARLPASAEKNGAETVPPANPFSPEPPPEPAPAPSPVKKKQGASPFAGE